jgi:predicted amidohydrolase YtcJ
MSTAPADPTADRPADLVLTGGSIQTVDAARSWAQALAVRDGRIVAVGTDAAVRPHVGPSTRVVELRGRTVTPGFQDAHVHPLHGGLARLRCELHEQKGLDTYLAIVAAYAADHPERPWITGGGWSMDDFPGGVPQAADLDRVVADRPVFLTNRDGHGAWVNSRALELAGVTAGTADPPDGRIERDAGGAPSGTLHEGAMKLVTRLLPEDTEEDLLAALELAQAYLHSLGITAWQDAWLAAPDLAAYRSFAEAGRLTARVVGALWWDRSAGLEQIESFVEQRETASFDRFRATSIKLMLDGVLENFTGAMLDPYLEPDGRPGDRRGIDFIEPELLRTAVARIDALGFQPHFHAIGDRAVRNALDAVEAARSANGMTDTRPHVAHIQVIHPADIARFRALGVVANAQPFWACHEPQMDDLTIPFLGAERTAWQYPFRSLRAAGAMLAMGSDWSVSTANPLREMEIAITRVPEDHREREPLGPDERLDPIDALAAFTIGSAHVNHLETDTGSLEAGKLADLAILDRDVFAPDAGPLGQAKVVATFVDGRAVFDTLET